MKLRRYTKTPLFTPDYEKVRAFLWDSNAQELRYPGFPWGRWEWMTTHSMLDRDALGQIGLWEEGDRIVGLATYESVLGDGYLFYRKGWERLYPEMLRYAKEYLQGKDGIRVLIDNNHREEQRIAAAMGMMATVEREETAALEITADLSYKLPEGYRIISMADGWDYGKYNEVMWRGFHHEGPAPAAAEDIRVRKEMLSSPMIKPEIVLCVVAPDGTYASHCGMWYKEGDAYALVEPVATHPDYRRMGLGRAAVLEAAKRCGQMGAQRALVGSGQQFYYSIGFAPIHTGTWWVEKEGTSP
ncbi:GNAT family N-acetyltransferase [Eubacteriales bacterium OttesenSCG-928-M02]|nr:GNAT family N-acetyltransferase [Eubacteriales bacterium OttesenSCG-928-M02]